MLSIVIPCKNEQNYIGRLLDSLVQQTAVTSATPIFVCDAGSTDNTLAILQQYKEQHQPNLTILPGGLPPAGRNNGGRVVTTPYVLFLDADVILGEPETLQTSLNLAHTQQLDLVVTHIRPLENHFLDHLLWRGFSLAAKMKLRGAVATGMFMLLRTEVFRASGGFNEQMLLGDDVEMARFIAPGRYALAPTFIYTTSRRFQKYGYLRTFKEYLQVFFSRQHRLAQRKDYFAVRYDAD